MHVAIRHALAGLAVGGAGFMVPFALVASAEPNECTDPSASWCLEDGTPGDPAPGEVPSGGGGSGSPDEPACGWVTIPAEVVPAATSSRPYTLTNGRPPEGLEVVWQGWCYRESILYYRGPFRWFEVGEPAPTMTLDDVAAAAYDRLRGRLPDPVVVTSPAAGVDAVVDVPVFVSVTNWQAELVENWSCQGLVDT